MLAAMEHLVLILVLGALRPRACAQMAQHAPGLAVWGAHILGLMIGAGILVVGMQSTDAIISAVTGQMRYRTPFQPLGWEDNATFFGIAVAVGVAATFLAGLIAAPFAWRDEPVRTTWQHTLRMVRLFTPAWMTPAAAAPVMFALFAEWPTVGMGPGPVQLTLLIAVPGLLVWCLYIAAAAVSAREPVHPDEWEPCCETCGYLLHHVPASHICPECGEKIDSALDPQHRNYPPANDAALAHGAPPTSPDEPRPFPPADAWTRPREFFTRVRMETPAFPLLRRAALAHVAAAAVAFFVIIVGFSVVSGDPMPADVGLAFACVAFTFGIGVTGLWCAGAGIIGLIASIRVSRNLLRAAFIVASYTSMFFVLWFAVSAAGLVIIFALGNAGLLRSPFWPMMLWLTGNAVMAAFYSTSVWRRMRYVCYGNWRFAEAARVDDTAIANAEASVG
ncbi:MAG TPA: hypothetical protein P5572_15875 [Phycisphaerae bacterium]|nr:hypothetical protein [Phycisphaerales bacterium]HRX86501.1 hypothetical protein [Phycisphaerae bacterium]